MKDKMIKAITFIIFVIIVVIFRFFVEKMWEFIVWIHTMIFGF